MVRNSWIVATAEGRATSVGVGPRKSGGWASATVTLRTASGDISDPIELTAGGVWHGDSATTDGRADAHASAHAYLTVPAGMRVWSEPRRDGGIDLHIVQRDDRS